MKQHFLIFFLLCPVTVLKSECEMLDINEGHLFHEERESLKKVSIEEVLGEDAETIHSNCFESENLELKTE